LINNRQGGRRRGRGGQGSGRNLGGQPGNRQDNRQRGNAAQLLEKYKSMARDSQLAGDRVQTEYYLQFADHYFRVLGESRSRFEDQRPQRDDGDDDDGGDDDFEGAEAEASGDDRQDRNERQDRNDRNERQDRPQRGERQDRAPRPSRPEREPRRFNRDEGSADDGQQRAAPAPRVNGRDDSLPLDVLPPAIGADDGHSDEAPAPRPRRRPRAARPADGEDEVAPAA
jgi:uncharacterized protein DUF4167